MTTGKEYMNKQIQEAIRVFNQGGIVIFPTDTAFGIGCRVDNTAAVHKLYKIRRRPSTQAASLLVADEAMAKVYVTDISKDVKEKLMKPFFPGGLTLVLQSRIGMIPSLVMGGGQTIGIRMPDHDNVLSVIRGVGVPILGPSANFHGEKTPFRQEDLDPALIKQVDYILSGICKKSKASTVIDCTSSPWKIIREGAVTITL